MKSIKSRQQWPFYVLLALWSAGILISGALLWHHENLVHGLGQAQLSFCTEGSVFNCNAVNSSSFAEIAGVPVVLWAIPTYLILIGLLFRRKKIPGVRWMITTAGFLMTLFSLYLGGISFFILKALCLWCSVLYGINLATFVLPWFFPRPTREEIPKLGTWVKSAAVFAGMAGVALFAQMNYRESVQEKLQVLRAQQRPDAQAQQWVGKCAPSFSLPDLGLNKNRVVTFGKEQKKPVLLVFWNVRCGHCREELPILHQYALKRPEAFEVLTVTKIYPDELDEEPNRKTETFEFLKDHQMNWPVLNDTKGLSSALQVMGTPTSVLISPQGRITGYWKGSIPQLEQVFDEALRVVASSEGATCEKMPNHSEAGLLE